MKSLTYIFFCFLLCSCSVNNEYYQLYKVNNDLQSSTAPEKLIYEDKFCKIKYDFWGNGGDFGFYIYNKTESYLILDLSNSFFVLNGLANCYFQNRTTTESTSHGGTATNYNFTTTSNQKFSMSSMNSRSYSNSITELAELKVPPKSSISVREFNISSTRYIDCDLRKTPSSNDIKTLTFDNTNSPFKFYNILTYRVLSETVKVENKYYVSEIANYPKDKILKTIYQSNCGTLLDFPYKAFAETPSDKFYLIYTAN